MRTFMILPTLPAAGSRYDALIVGAGAAGLLAGHELLSRVPGAHLLIADAGLPLDERRQQTTSAMGGSGGAGLYLGGRLYLGPATVPVAPPGQARRSFRVVLEGEPYERRANRVNALLTACGATAPVRPVPDRPLLDAIDAARGAGLEYVTSYPARLLGVEERRDALAALMHRLERMGATFLFGARATPVAHHAGGFEVALAAAESGGEVARDVIARTLLLAPGRYGAEWLVDVMRHLDAPVVSLPSAFGVRIEVPAAAYAPLTDINPDPRLQRMLAEDAVIKTYATCPGGRVVSMTRYGARVASGVPLPLNERRPSTTAAVLVQPGAAGAASAWRGGAEIARRLNTTYPDRLVVQRLADARSRRATNADALVENAVQPTCEDAVPGRLDDVYLATYWDAFEDFLARLSRLAPGLETGDMLLYGPAEERYWHFPTDDTLQTSVPGLFVAGDGAGQTQGVIQAGVAGGLAGEGIARLLSG